MKHLRTPSNWVIDSGFVVECQKMTYFHCRKYMYKTIKGNGFFEMWPDAKLCGVVALLGLGGRKLSKKSSMKVFVKEAFMFFYNEMRWTRRHDVSIDDEAVGWIVGRTWATQEISSDAMKVAKMMADRWGIRSVYEMIDAPISLENALRASTIRRELGRAVVQ